MRVVIRYFIKSLTDANLRLALNINEANIGTAIIQNYERAQEIYDTAESSSGRALKENEVYLDSIQGMRNDPSVWQHTSYDTSNCR